MFPGRRSARAWAAALLGALLACACAAGAAPQTASAPPAAVTVIPATAPRSGATVLVVATSTRPAAGGAGTAGTGGTPTTAGTPVPARTNTPAPPPPSPTPAPPAQNAAAGATSTVNAQLGQIRKREFWGSASIAEIDQMENRFLVIDHDVPSHYAVDWYRIEFTGADPQGRPLPLVAQVFVPKAADVSNFPLYVFGPGTTGLVDECAPSREAIAARDWGDFQSHLLTYATQGYVAVMPDFEGFNDPDRYHHYYVGDIQARVLIDAARAALRFLDPQGASPTTKGNPVFFAGYSHGGYVALAARDLAPRYAPELRVRGAIGYGPRSDPTTLFKDFPSLAPYLLWSYADYYGKDKVPVDRILQSRWARTFERDVLSKCIDEVTEYYGGDPRGIFTPEFLTALDNGTLGEQFPTLKELLDRNKAGFGSRDVPVLVLQGTEDTVVYPATLQRYMRELCATGARGAYLSYPGIPHSLTRQVSYEDTLFWMATVLRGQATRSSCG